MKSKTKSRELILQDSTVVFSNSHESLIQARLLHFSHRLAIFETQSPDVIVQTSEVLLDFRILVNSRPIYSGRAIVTSSVTTGPTVICQASLEDAWLDLEAFKLVLKPKQLRAGFDGFINSWQKVYQILPEYKIVIADIQTFLSDLRLWLEQVELGIRSSPAEDQAKLEEEIAHDLRGPVGSALGNMFERFEAICANIEEDMHPAHRAFGQRQLHSLLLCAPFIHRTYAKPLGYAGDYEMMNMIVRNGLEGNSLYAKLVNGYLLDQVGPQSVRNRVDYLNNRIVDETSRMTALGKIAKIYCIACGPAWEARNFIAESPLANHAQFELLDFNEETLQHTQSKIDDVKKLHQRRTPVKFVRSSVQNLLVG
jgi:extracellular factor (EF) 3-hydroxypalmitic acid methyl ester biosynthesis protein